uniref:Uncharacterized protein n=1 Tax=Setaria italica TaxID=4555 RepID=K4A3H6_SETIT
MMCKLAHIWHLFVSFHLIHSLSSFIFSLLLFLSWVAATRKTQVYLRA